MQIDERDVGRKEVILRIKPASHRKLVEMTLKRSVELGRKVGMGFVFEEMLEQMNQMEDPEQRSADLFGSHE
jgi:hypothetical protein